MLQSYGPMRIGFSVVVVSCIYIYGEFYGEAVDILIVFEAQSFGQAAAE